MFRTRASAASGPSRTPPYALASKQPLHILTFLLPLVIAYEIGLAVLLRGSEGVLTNKAHETLLLFFNIFGINDKGGLYLGGAALVTVLLVWHLLNRDPWRIDPTTPAIMAIESLLLAIPLIVLGLLMADRQALSAVAAGTAEEALAGAGIWSGVAISIGAGLYEELLFRMLLIAVLHTLLVDVAKISSVLGAGIAVLVSAAAFCWYHLPPHAQAALFYLVAGLYFGAVYVTRGFGIVVGVHAFYDIVVLQFQLAS